MSSPTVTLVCLHALGSSGREFDAVGELLGEGFDVLALDLPGFGDAPFVPGAGVEGTADAVAAAIAARVTGPWMLVGHSMGGKIASVLAARAAGSAPARGATAPTGPAARDLTGRDSAARDLVGVVLVAGSPLGPEPMEEERREEMLSWVEPEALVEGRLSEAAAREFVAANVGAPLDAGAEARALEDLQRMSPAAWRAWLAEGSKEDRSIPGTITLPALILAGGADGDLGENAQRRLNAPLYEGTEVLVLEGAGHLMPLERPLEVADAIRRFHARVITDRADRDDGGLAERGGGA
jgi:pimeloyl-ACP methyl ester carboxylesterase